MGLEPVRRGEGVVFLKGLHKWGRRFMPLSFAGTGLKAALQDPYDSCEHQFTLVYWRYVVIFFQEIV